MDPNGPNLSQYFANDPPSFFDNLANEIPQITPATTATTTPALSSPIITNKSQSLTHFSNILPGHNYDGTFKPSEYIELSAELDNDGKISENTRNAWHTWLSDTKTKRLTMTAIRIPNDLPDKIGEAVKKHLDDNELSKRKILDVTNVTQDERGLRTLIVCGCYRAAVNLTGRLLTVYGQGYGRHEQQSKHSPHSLQLWFTRLALLVKLGEYELLQQESEQFHNLTGIDINFEYYPEMYPKKKGSMASFSFRLLLAEIPLYFGQATVALNRLSEMLFISQEIRQNLEEQHLIDDANFWIKRETRLLHAIINCGIVKKDYELIEGTLTTLLKDYSFTREERRSLFSVWGRIYLQIGDIFGAEQKFAEARRLREINSPPDVRDLIDKGLITVASNDFPDAYKIFQKALHLDAGSTMILNNMGVCLLYAGKLKDAINLFQRAIELNPQKSLNESLLINLSTLYELESNNSKSKKLNLLRLINRYKPDLHVDVEICLKLKSTN